MDSNWTKIAIRKCIRFLIIAYTCSHSFIAVEIVVVVNGHIDTLFVYMHFLVYVVRLTGRNTMR